MLADEGLKYSALNTARSALSSVLDKTEGYFVGQHPNVCALVRGVYNTNPPKPRYTTTWDVNKVFQVLLKWGPNDKLDLRQLTFKTTMLLFLVTSQRGQTISLLPLKGLRVGKKLVFAMGDLTKHLRVGDPLETIVLEPYPKEPLLCVVTTVKDYIIRTKDLRCPETGQYLILSYDVPYHSVKTTTLGRYVTEVLKQAGINADEFSKHSCRGASTSKAEALGASALQIMKHARWRSVTSFAKHYRKNIDKHEDDVPNMLLDDAVKRCKTQQKKAAKKKAS